MFGMDMTMQLAPMMWGILALLLVSAVSVLAAHHHQA